MSKYQQIISSTFKLMAIISLLNCLVPTVSHQWSDVSSVLVTVQFNYATNTSSMSMDYQHGSCKVSF